ncbi:regulatory protein RecX [Providencia rustigianii]|uniref:regulatory protein RecX n=1 Tax=Providencia rustigianii TaxID=158850 RepID=UPI00223F80D0|nr:regulatory protein RecX [Providencia rustigianii]
MTTSELYNIAVGLLARRDYSTAEITRYLSRSIGDEEVVSAVITQLREHHYLDDLKIAENERDKGIRKLHGPTRIKQEIKQKGIPDDIITQVMENAGTDWFDLAEQYRRKKFGLSLPDDPKEKSKQIRHMQYKGYPFGIIMELYA